MTVAAAALRTLGPGDETALESFLRRHAHASMFLRSNARAGGLVDRGEPLQATYVAAVEDGAVVGVAAHCWNGMVLMQAPDGSSLEALVCAAAQRSGRAVEGLAGPWAQVTAARVALGLGAAATTLDSREALYALDLADLVVPRPLAAGLARCRPPADVELPALVAWRAAFCVEALGAADGAALRAECKEDVARLHGARAHFVLEEDAGQAVAYAAFNAALPDTVQVGGVYVPGPLRGRGRGRAVVAGALLAAREGGVAHALLFTAEANAPARSAYESLGFRPAGDYGLVLFADPVPPPPT
ncbi:MAG TPA: GNAT family N-acetyltransferase [Myxococcota bacterium]|nr:GNAT family N-acetyltransferase [Myxococcota bacterium]